MTAAIPTRDRILDAAEHLVLEQGFNATTVDAVLAATGTSKGAFFHHFPSKADLGRALVERYAAADAEVLERFMAGAEATSEDPAAQLIAFIRAFEDASDEMFAQPGCLFVTFIYERVPKGTRADDIIVWSIKLWRDRILEKLEQASGMHPPAIDVDLPSLADQVYTVFEGAYILARATADAGLVAAQLAHVRHYLELLFADRP
jgi:TetR/AcrR family transcriptional repressor of nem operon